MGKQTAGRRDRALGGRIEATHSIPCGSIEGKGIKLDTIRLCGKEVRREGGRERKERKRERMYVYESAIKGEEGLA